MHIKFWTLKSKTFWFELIIIWLCSAFCVFESLFFHIFQYCVSSSSKTTKELFWTLPRCVYCCLWGNIFLLGNSFWKYLNLCMFTIQYVVPCSKRGFHYSKPRSRKHLQNQMFLKIFSSTRWNTMIRIQLFMYSSYKSF